VAFVFAVAVESVAAGSPELGEAGEFAFALWVMASAMT
jgi:hypothetical protein